MSWLRLILLMASAMLAGAPSAAEETAISVPSGQSVTLLDTIAEEPGPEGVTIRFRFLAPEIARDTGTIGFDDAAADMAYLCESFAVPRVSESEANVARIIISLSDRPVEFGQSAPDATQFFEAYRLEDGACIWEGL